MLCLTAAAKALPDAKARAALAPDYLRLRGQSPAVVPLNTLATTHFQGRKCDELTALIIAMGRADLDETFRRVSRDNIALEDVLTKDFEHQIYAFQEDMDINSLDGARRVNAALPVHKTIVDLCEGAPKSLYQACNIFDMHPPPGFHTSST